MNYKKQLSLYFILILFLSNYCKVSNKILIENSDHNKIDTLEYSELYPNLFDYKYNNLILDTCIYDFAIINLNNKQIIKYIPPYLGALCLEKIDNNKISAKLRTGFDFKDKGFYIHVFNIYTDNKKIYIEHINKIDTFQIKEYFINDINNIENQQEVLNFLVEKYFYKAFADKKYIDSLEILYQLHEDYLDVSYINARSILFHIDTITYDSLPSHYYNNVLYKKKELLQKYKSLSLGID